MLCARQTPVAVNRLASKLDAKSKEGCMSSILMLMGMKIRPSARARQGP